MICSFSQDDDFAATIFESSYCFQDIYTCRQILYYTSFKWTIDLPISECNVCDNCIRRSQDKAVRVNVYNDLLRMLNVTEKLLRMVTERKLMSFGREELVDVFLKAENKNTRDKNLSLFWNEEEDASYKPIISTRDACFHMVDKLIAKGLIRQNVIIEPLHSGSSILTYSCSIVSISPVHF